MQATPIVMSWSGGKDSAMALYALQKEGKYDVQALITTVNTDYDRVSIHGVQKALLQKQAESIGIPLHIVELTSASDNDGYEQAFCTALLQYKEQGITGVAYGDIFLQDLRNHREAMLKKHGMHGIFPLWDRDTKQLAKEFIDSGFMAHLSCAATEVLDGSFAGKEFTKELLRELPSTVDPCGEKGEFHSFVHNGPIFSTPIACRVNGLVERGYYVYADIV